MNYEQYHQKGGTYVIPVEVFDDLLDEKDELEKEKQELINYLKGEIDKYEQSICKILKENNSGWGDIGFYEETRKLSDTYFKMKEILSKMKIVDLKCKQFVDVLKENKQLKGSLQTHEILLKANVEENQKLKEDILFCLKSIEQEMLSCYQILNEWSDK